MKILSVNKYYWKKGGSESVFFSEKEMLENSGHEVVPFAMASDRNEETKFSEHFVEEVDYERGGLANKISSAAKIIYSTDAKSKMSGLLKQFSPDLAHFHVFQHQISPSVFGPLRKNDVPIILTLHDLKPICPSYKFYVDGKICEKCIDGAFYNCFLNKCTKGSTVGSLVNTIEMYFHSAMNYYKDVDQYIAVSKFYQNKMIEAGYPSEQISYLPNFIDASQFDASADDDGYILYFGRLSEEKGISTLFAAAQLTPEIKYSIVGTGPLLNDLMAEVENLNLKNVTFHGFKTGNELKQLLAKARCVVVPSEWYENCPMTVLEAFASGRPVIGANIGGIPELIDEGNDGFIFEPGDEVELATKIEAIWMDGALAQEMGMSGLNKVQAKFNRKTHYEGLLSIYKGVVK